LYIFRSESIDLDPNVIEAGCEIISLSFLPDKNEMGSLPGLEMVLF
jgi:hypothetical protein